MGFAKLGMILVNKPLRWRMRHDSADHASGEAATVGLFPGGHTTRALRNYA
jgi:hypothetical protein